MTAPSKLAPSDRPAPPSRPRRYPVSDVAPVEASTPAMTSARVEPIRITTSVSLGRKPGRNRPSKLPCGHRPVSEPASNQRIHFVAWITPA